MSSIVPPKHGHSTQGKFQSLEVVPPCVGANNSLSDLTGQLRRQRVTVRPRGGGFGLVQLVWFSDGFHELNAHLRRGSLA